MQDSRRERGGERACTYTSADVRGKHRLEISFLHIELTARRSQATSASEEAVGRAARCCTKEES